MVTVINIESRPLGSLEYRTASRRGARKARLPVLRARVRGLPAGLDCIVAAADLQGRDRRGKLLGEALAAALGKNPLRKRLPPAARTAVILAGDMFTHARLSRMGGKGDVDGVWIALARKRRWLVGVLGNHDLYRGAVPEELVADVADGTQMYLLNGQTVEVDGLRVGGVGGSVRGINKGSAEEQRYLQRVAPALAGSPDVLVLHHGPAVRPGQDLGLVRLRELVEQAPPTLVIYGHKPSELLHRLPSGAQLLNVRETVVVLERTD
jgi:hypothetical protein